MPSEKSQIARKNRGLTQEEPTEKLSISGQAIAKWEAGHTYPDVTDLIGISNLFNVTVDYLVKEQECSLSITGTRGKNIERLILFRSEANVNTYVAYVNETSPARLDSHDSTCTNAPYLYHDTYVGGEKLAGEEVIRHEGNVQYTTNYCGQVLGQQFSRGFLKEALREANMKIPHRGPEYYQSGEYTYKRNVVGDFTWFQGYEEIYRNIERVYECYPHDGTTDQNLQIYILPGRW